MMHMPCKALQVLTDLGTPCNKEATPFAHDAVLLTLPKIISDM
jgi:hypothetical protein